MYASAVMTLIHYEGPECDCRKNRNLQPDHAPDCMMLTDITAWQTYMDLTNKVADEVNRRLSITE